VEQHREMTCRVAWKPYMHSLTHPNLLPSVRTPTLIVWGRQDSIAPLNCGQLYHRSIVNSHLVEIDKCGHMPEMEQPEQFVSMVTNFLST
jgi:2-hydroxy-6-oxonona-2,4-dienedioate hydrolase